MKQVARLILKYSEIVAVSFQAETKCNLKLDNGIFKTTNSKNVLVLNALKLHQVYNDNSNCLKIKKGNRSAAKI